MNFNPTANSRKDALNRPRGLGGGVLVPFQLITPATECLFKGV